VSSRCRVVWCVLLCFGRSGETTEPPSRLQVKHVKQQTLIVTESTSTRETDICPCCRFVPRHADELYLETDDPVLMLNQSEDLWCQGYNMRTGATGIFPAFYAVRVAKDSNQGAGGKNWNERNRIEYRQQHLMIKLFFSLSFVLAVQKDGWIKKFLVQFLGSVQVPIHKGNDMLCAAMQKVHTHTHTHTHAHTHTHTHTHTRTHTHARTHTLHNRTFSPHRTPPLTPTSLMPTPLRPLLLLLTRFRTVHLAKGKTSGLFTCVSFQI